MGLNHYALLIFCLLVYSAPTQGQQNLFNIPSGDITPGGKWFYQHQFNIYSQKIESKGHFVYGLGKGWDAGLNLVGKGAYFTPEWRGLYNSDAQKGAVYPVLMATVQKQWTLSDRVAINAGTQMGFNISKNVANKELNYFHYGLLCASPVAGLKVTGGGYLSNRPFIGMGNVTGVMLGFEAQVNDHFYVMGDWLSGRNDAAVAVLGGMYQATDRLQLCMGWAVPNPRTPKPAALVLEINLYGWQLTHSRQPTHAPAHLL